MSNPVDSHASVAELKNDLVLANHVLAHHGVLDAFGHVSVRHPAHPDRFLISRSWAPELVELDDIIVLDLDARIVEGGSASAKPYLESFIHAEIYRARPDVMSVVHSHAQSVIPFGVVDRPLRPVYHMAGFLSKGAPVFDIRRCFGCTDMLVRNADHGRELARSLGDASVALMRGHGFVTTGDSIPAAVYRAIYTEANAAVQSRAMAMSGEVTYLDVEEGLAADETNARNVNRPWELWKRHVARKHPGG